MANEKNKNPKFATWKTLVFSTTIGLLVYYLLGYGFSPSQFYLEGISVFEFLYFSLIDQFMVEALYTFLILKSMEVYTVFFKVEIKQPGENKLSSDLLKFIPFFGLIFFLVNPITQTIRYIIRNGFSFNSEVLLNEYLFSLSLYIVYTVFGSLVGLLVILMNGFNAARVGKRQENPLDRLVGEHEAVMKPVNAEEICFIEIRDRKYWAITASKELRISKTISKLEAELDSNKFIRISRGVIINVNYIESYSPWENGSYLVELKTPKKREFSISRNRVKEFKRVMKI